MRVLVIGKSKRHTRRNVLLARGFANLGHRVVRLNYSRARSLAGRRLADFYMQLWVTVFRPDLILVASTDIPPRMLSRWRSFSRVAIYYADYTDPLSARIVKCGRNADLFFITNRGQIPALYEEGVKEVHFVTGGCDAKVHRRVFRVPERFQSDVAFIGRPSPTERVEFLRDLQAKFQVKIWGPGWENYGLKSCQQHVDIRDYRRICAGARIVIGYDATDQVELYFSNRTWLTLGCGGFLLTRYVPSLERLFVRRKHLDWFGSMSECAERIEYYLANPQEREQIAQNGHAHAHQNYRFSDVAQAILAAAFQKQREQVNPLSVAPIL
ncbi:MAG: glycosyltransferase [Acidobacteria bacterium]|nr:glycosyltransferase [Acidobacteriota bacterium]